MGEPKYDEPPEVLTCDEVARLLKLRPKTVMDLCAKGDIPCARKVGGRWRIRKDLLWEWLDGRKAG